MRPLIDMLMDEKTFIDEICAVNYALEDPEIDIEVDALNRRLDHLDSKLTEVRKEIRSYFDYIQK